MCKRKTAARTMSRRWSARLSTIQDSRKCVFSAASIAPAQRVSSTLSSAPSGPSGGAEKRRWLRCTRSCSARIGGPPKVAKGHPARPTKNVHSGAEQSTRLREAPLVALHQVVQRAHWRAAKGSEGAPCTSHAAFLQQSKEASGIPAGTMMCVPGLANQEMN